MSSPAYQLRPNKAVDRFVLVDAIRRLERFGSLSQYTYYGLGGPYLEDFRVLYEQCSDINMVSIEKDRQVFKRQEFHLPAKTVKLLNMDLFDFVDEYEPNGQKSIFWLDYTDLKYRNIEYFMLLLERVATGSIIKVTLRAKVSDYREGGDDFKRQFQGLAGVPSSDGPIEGPGYAKWLQDVLRISSQRALTGSLSVSFLPICSFRYSDGTPMLTVTGIVCEKSDEGKYRREFQAWEFANLDWAEPQKIDVPFLSTKERLYLQAQLPCGESAGEVLSRALGYRIEKSEERTNTQLSQYSTYHRQYPYFIRSVP